MSYRYFAYGSSLDPEHFAEWSKEHGYEGRTLSPEDGSVAVIDDMALVFTVPSRAWMGAVATLEPRPGASVYGVLFTLDDSWSDVIRHKEGVASGLYQEIEVEARLVVPGAEDATLQLLSASAFRAAPERLQEGLVPSKKWLESVMRGAAAHGLPDLWIAELRRRVRG